MKTNSRKISPTNSRIGLTMVSSRAFKKMPKDHSPMFTFLAKKANRFFPETSIFKD